jgi:hypothetical protein
MSTWGQFVWNFDEGTVNKFEALLEDGRFEDIAEEILAHTYLSTVFVDAVRGIMSDYDYNEDKFNDDVLVAIRIIHDRYELIKEENEEDSID